MDTSPAASGCPFRLNPTAPDIHGETALLRAQGPATKVELPGSVSAWEVTDPALIKQLLTDHRISKDARQHWPDYINGRIPSTWPLRLWVDVYNALTSYGEEHIRLRRLIAKAFTTRRIRALGPQIKDIAHHLLDQLQATTEPGETVDLRATFAWILPLTVVNLLLGVPERLHPAFRKAIGGIFATDQTPQEAEANNRELYQLLTDLVAAKRRAPGDDVTSALIAAHDDETNSGLTEQELLDSILLLIGAGHETTVNLLDHAIVNLSTHPQQLVLLRSGRVPWADAVEETLRHQPPVATIIMRFPTEDLHDEPSGITFRQGEPIVISYAAVGRDPHLHGDNADHFDITRPSRRDHLSFGFGPHYCLGAELARLEAEIALRALFHRFPDLTLAVSKSDLRPLESFISNGHQQLPIVLHSGTAKAA
ncbi:cytochrome P450 family protein [Streptomyces sp. Inha503]|uniref:cytochrome P450 family protein n=1 Tax=Streptomyces sp. Inha503 TaxID=3383314 RepID=UPI00399F50F7